MFTKKYKLTPYAITEYTVFPHYKKNESMDSEEFFIKKKENTKNNKSLENLNKGYGHKTELSKVTQRKIKQAVNWILQNSTQKKYQTKKKDISFNYRLSFITLTLPVEQRHKDTEITKSCLNQFLTELRKNYKMSNYVWRAESQKNGNIHYHIITDSRANYYVLRYSWNRILSKLGYISEYQKRYKDMSVLEYSNHRKKKEKDLTFDTAKKVYESQKKLNWTQPNTVNVVRAKSSREIGAYLAKYISKSSGSRVLSGKRYGVSQSVNKLINSINQCQDILKFCYQYSRDVLKKEVITADYYSTILVRLDSLFGWIGKELNNWYNKIIEDIGYIAGVDNEELNIYEYQVEALFS